MDMKETIGMRADRAISDCFEMIAHLTFMKTISSETEDGRYRLKDRISELVDIDKSIVHEIRELNNLI